MHETTKFKSFVQAGFECSTHQVRSGRRLDVISATHHDVLAKQDYRSLLGLGIQTVREGLRWHLVEKSRARYDFGSMLGLLDAAQELGLEQIIDLFHFGWPDHIDIFQDDFVESFGELAFCFARLLRARGLTAPYLAPMNEISFVAWGGGDVGYLNPFQYGRGPELKRQLVRAGLRAAEAILSELPQARLVWPEPMIHIAGDPARAGDETEAEACRLWMYEAWDMILGRSQAELGGRPEFAYLLGINFYDRNQRLHNGPTLERSDQLYRPFHLILLEVWNRYRLPLFVSETGTEGAGRPEWFSYISEEVRLATQLGVPVKGVCLYPILNHPGWDDDRHCQNGLLDYPASSGEREIYWPLAAEITRQQKLNSALYTGQVECID